MHENGDAATMCGLFFASSLSDDCGLSGSSPVFKRKKQDLLIFAVERGESAVLSGKQPGSHKIEGIDLGFPPPLWNPSEVNKILTVSTDDARAMARKLAKEEAIFAGISTGANIVASLRVAARLGSGATIATLIVDSCLRYLSTDVFR